MGLQGPLGVIAAQAGSLFMATRSAETTRLHTVHAWNVKEIALASAKAGNVIADLDPSCGATRFFSLISGSILKMTLPNTESEL